MVAPTTTIRWTVTMALVAALRLRSDLTGVQVEAGFPGDEQRAESIWVDELDGEIEIPVMTAGRKYRDDRFEIPFEMRVAGKVTLDATMTRLAVLVAAVEDELATNPTIQDFEGVVAAEVSRERMTAASIKGSGFIGFAEVRVSVHARLQGE